MPSPSFQAQRLRSTAALTAALSAPTISDMIVELVYGAEKLSDVLFYNTKSNFTL